eukprot:TRINITY_DN6809_c0_g1_i1.p1 TRINITY_DN6809_c0_g1~~TRINITY_DN6809_c0_g1_i1.p1  ORF type:complete len:587 (-),score=186.20 TRINITY_DN6809_c0_g1_i1:209-1969(-)
MLKSSRDKIEPGGGGESNSPRWGNAFGSLGDDESADRPANTNRSEKSQSGLSDYNFAIEQDDEEDMSVSADGAFVQVDADDHSIMFFRSLLSSEAFMRRRVLGAIMQALNASLESDCRLIKAQLPTLVMMSTEAPFADIRTTFSDYLASIKSELKLRGIQCPNPSSGPSVFFPKSVVPIDTKEEPVATFFKQIFLETGRVSHIDRVLAWHPSYFTKFMEMYDLMMKEPGPLPLHLRNYIAILSASRFECAYLVRQQEIEFLLNDGDPDWLDGVHKIPKKIQNLLEINAILAHQPWQLNKDHIAALIKGEDAWSVAELVHALVLMASYRALAGVVWGMGITPEVDYEGLTAQESSGDDSAEAEEDSNNAQVIEKLKQKHEEERELPAEERKHLFEQAGQDANLSEETAQGTSGQNAKNICQKYIGSHVMAHADFDVKAKGYDVFHVEDYSWREQGYELMKTYYSEAANLLEEEFEHIFNMTDNSFNEEGGLDTSPFRRSVWYYVHRIQGLLHDDYDYSLVNMFMNKQLKLYIKKMVCVPHTITRHDVVNLGYNLKPSEKCHIALLATEAGRQAELLYGLHAVMKLMS